MDMKTFGQRPNVGVIDVGMVGGSKRPNVGVIDVGMVGGKSATQCWCYRCGDGRGKVSDPMLVL